jgi:hypothetical protein
LVITSPPTFTTARGRTTSGTAALRTPYVITRSCTSAAVPRLDAIATTRSADALPIAREGAAVAAVAAAVTARADGAAAHAARARPARAQGAAGRRALRMAMRVPGIG